MDFHAIYKLHGYSQCTFADISNIGSRETSSQNISKTAFDLFRELSPVQTFALDHECVDIA